MNTTTTTTPPERLGTRAVVIGASIGGLLAARVLIDHFAEVHLVERDELGPYGDYRKGVQQARHAHGLLAGGARAMEELLPGLTAELAGRGAIVGDLLARVRFSNEGYTLQGGTSELEGIATSRLLLEDQIRTRVLAIAGVVVHERCDTVELRQDERGRVDGLRITQRDTGETRMLDADLVIDASGRGSRTPAWLDAMGFGQPQADQVVVNLAYTTREFVRTAGDGDAIAIVSAGSLANPRSGVLVSQPDGRCVVTIAGYLGDAAPTDLDGFRAFAASLDAPHIADAIADLAPIGDARTFKYHASTWRRYDRMRRFPDGFVVFGDAICSFNPIYGQGMTVGAREALHLRRCLREGGVDRLARRFFRAAAREIATPWKLAASADLRLPGVQGRYTLEARLVNRYLRHYFRAAASDAVLTRRFIDVVNLLARPETLLRPSTIARVVRARSRVPLAVAAPVADRERAVVHAA